MPVELRQVEQLLRSLQINIERQVIIEAKVIDVELNSGSQQGINWSGPAPRVFRGGVGRHRDVDRRDQFGQSRQCGLGRTLGDLLGGQLLGSLRAERLSAGWGGAAGGELLGADQFPADAGQRAGAVQPAHRDAEQPEGGAEGRQRGVRSSPTSGRQFHVTNGTAPDRPPT
jgi:hypothetical protein